MCRPSKQHSFREPSVYRVRVREVPHSNARKPTLFLLGASGSGKSTLLNIIGGLDVRTSGEVFYRDHKLTIYDDAEANYQAIKTSTYSW